VETELVLVARLTGSSCRSLSIWIGASILSFRTGEAGDKWSTTAAAPASSIFAHGWSLESGGGRWQLEEETRSRPGDCCGARSLRQRAVGKRGERCSILFRFSRKP